MRNKTAALAQSSSAQQGTGRAKTKSSKHKIKKSQAQTHDPSSSAPDFDQASGPLAKSRLKDMLDNSTLETLESKATLNSQSAPQSAALDVAKSSSSSSSSSEASPRSSALASLSSSAAASSSAPSQANPDAVFETASYADVAVAVPADTPKVYPVVVYTAQELADAQRQGAERILVKGQLASKLETALKAIRSVGASSLNTLALVVSGAALLAPFTGGVSLGAAGTVMGTLGAAVTAAAIAAISAIGLSLVVAVVKGYDEVKIGGGGLELVIKKHVKTDNASKEDADISGVAKLDTSTSPNASNSPNSQNAASCSGSTAGDFGGLEGAKGSQYAAHVHVKTK